MQQMVITYVLSGLANIADVNPRDVHTSLFNGNVRVNNLSLRPETMNKLLPFPIEEGTVPEMELQIPNPSTSSPMEVKVRHARLLLQMDLSTPPAERTPEQILRGVTAASILGDAATETAEAASEPISPLDSHDANAAAFDYSSANSEVDEEEDFASCASDGDTSDTESLGSFGSPTSAAEDAQAAPSGGTGGGWMDYLRARAAQSVEWIWRRQLRIAFTDVTLVLPCDTRKNIHYEIGIESFTVIVEPTQMSGAEQMKIIHMEIGGASVFASAGDARSRVVVVEALSVKITTVCEATSERVLRKNVVVSFKGTNTLLADEATLFALLKCHLSRQTRLAVPPYCLPFSSLRARGSLWPYARACVLQGLRDYRKRFNFNASYLRFYAQARERYVQLLNECHRHQSVMERRQQLAEAEQDLRHEDVILFLRQHVQRKYAASAAEPEEEGDEGSLEPLVVSSTHFEWKVIKVVLPARNTVYARDTTLILRNEETLFTVSAVSLDCGGAVQTVAAPSPAAASTADSQATRLTEESSLLYVHVRDEAGHKETKVSLQRVALRGSLDGALRCVTPIADALQRIAEQSRTGATTPMAQPASHSAPSRSPPPALVEKPTTSILALHGLEVQLDDFQLLLDHLSCTTAAAPGVPAKLGCTMRRCHVRHGEAFVLSPVEVRMTPRGGVVVTRVALQMSQQTWATLRKDADSIRLLYEKYPRFDAVAGQRGGSSAPAVPIASSNIDLDALKALQRVLQWSAVASCPPLEIEDISLAFEPLATTITMQRISVQTVAMAPRGPFGAHVTLRRCALHCNHTGRIALRVELNSGVRVGVSRDPAQALVVSIPEVAASGKRSTDSTEVPLLTLRGVEGVVHGTVQYHVVRSVLVANSISIRDAELVYKTDAAVPVYSDRPCLTSYMQVAAEVTAVDVEQLSAVPTRAVSHVLGEAYNFAVDEMVSENYYRTFFSCFSDMALRLALRDCVVRCGSGDTAEELVVSLANTTSEERLTELNVYRPHLQATTENFPILVLNDVGRLGMEVDVTCLAVRVSARPAVSPSEVALTVRGLKVRMPLEKMPYWRAEALEIPAVPQQIVVDSVRLVTRLDQRRSDAAVLDASLTAFAMETVTTTSWTVGSSLVLSMPRDFPLSPSESDRGSCASSVDEEVDTTHLSLRRWAVTADLSAALAEFYKLQRMVRTVVSAAGCFSRRVVLQESVANAEFHLDDCGDVFLDAPAELLVLRDCVFYAPTPDRHIVVCPGTSAVFRRCTFVHPSHATLIRTATRSALYACEECRLGTGDGATVLTSPTGAAMLSQAPSPGNVSLASDRRRTRTHVSVDEGSATVQLDAASRLVCTQKAFSLTSKRKTRRTFVKARVGELRVEYADAVQRVPVLSKTVAEGEVAVLLPRRSCSASCSVTCGEIVLPVVPAKLRALQERVAIVMAATSPQADGDVPASLYVVPPSAVSEADRAAFTSSAAAGAVHERFPYDSWKALLSLSLIPIAVQLPGGMRVAKVTLSNAFVWSRREPLAEAQIEARIALHDAALWEWQQQSFRSVISSPVFLGVQGRTSGPLSVSVTATLSPIDAAVSTDQLRLLLHAAATKGGGPDEGGVEGTALGAPPAADAPRERGPGAAAALRWRNDAGVALRVRGGQGETMTVPPTARGSEAGFGAAAMTAPFTICDADGVAVDHVERDAVALLSPSITAHQQTEPLFVARKVVVLADKRRLHVTSTLDEHLVQEIAVRTVVQVQNNTPFSLLLLSGGCQREHVVAPFELSCVPEAMQQRTDISVAVARGAAATATGFATLREPLFPDGLSAAAFYQHCYQQGYPAADMAREFVSQLDGSSLYMVTEIEMRGPVLLLVFRAARPHVANDTVFPLDVEAVSGRGEVLASERIEAGQRAFFFGLPPGIQVRGRVRLHVGAEAYETRELVALFDREAAALDANMVLAHTAHPRRYFFELDVAVAADGAAGVRGVAITTSHLCLVKNCTTTDLFFSTEDGDAVGTMGTAGMPGSADSGAVGYVPTNAVVCIKPKGAAMSEPFEVDDSGDGCVIQCDRAPEASAYSAQYYLLHMVPGSRAKLAELLPSVVFRNRHRRRTLCVKHVIRQGGSTRALEESIFEVGPQSNHCYYTLSKYGYTNDLLFAWKTEDANAPLSFSAVVETDLAPSTTWSGFICCGATHHQVEIAKGHLYEPAYVTVGPPVLPRVKLVNLTSVGFREVRSYDVAFPQPSKNNKYLVLTTVEGNTHTVDLMQEDAVELEPGVTVQAVRAEEDRCSVVLANGRVFVTRDKSYAEEMQLSMNVQMTSLSLRLRDGTAVPLHLLWRSFAVNVMWWCDTTSLQSSVTGVCLEISYDGRRQQVVEPFDGDISVRELRTTTRDVYLKGFYLGLQPLTITVSDVLLYHLQVVGSRCSVDRPLQVLAWVRQRVSTCILQSLPASLPHLFHIGSAGISETPLELSWDRSVRPPQDFLLGDSAVSKLIPSLHHAMLVIPKLQLRNVSRVSLKELLGRVQQILVVEVVKQIPKMVTTVGLFKKNSSLLEKVTSTVSSFLFRSSAETDTTDDGSSALI